MGHKVHVCLGCHFYSVLLFWHKDEDDDEKNRNDDTSNTVKLRPAGATASQAPNNRENDCQNYYECPYSDAGYSATRCLALCSCQLSQQSQYYS